MLFAVIGLVVAVMVMIAGLVLLKLGLLPPRRGTVPYCARCGYALTANVSGVCPECGTSTKYHPPVVGERRRRAGIGAIGLLLALVGVVGTVATTKPLVSRIDWYRLRPLGWVLEDAASNTPAVNGRAWGELNRRRSAGRLSEADEQRIDAAALTIQGDPKAVDPVSGALLHLGQRWDAGKLTAEQEKRMFAQSVRTTWTPRAIVLVGQRLPVRYAGERRLPASANVRDWYVRITNDGSNHDMEISSNGGAIHGYGGSMNGLDRKKATAPGPQVIEMREHVDIYRDREDLEQKKPPLAQHEVTHRLSIEAVKEKSPRYMKVVEDSAALRPRIEQAVRIRDFTIRPGSSPGYTVSIASPPVNVAFDVFARVDGKEYRQGGVTCAAGGHMNLMLNIWQLAEKKVTTADFILRPSERAARESVDLFDYWDGGEIVIKDMVVAEPER